LLLASRIKGVASYDNGGIDLTPRSRLYIMAVLILGSRSRALKADERLSSIPLIAVSGYASDENRQRAIRAGFDRVFSKPVKFREVSEVLAALSKRSD
jgi:DNA-binding response OmpR family regulator